jgi:hypothetical protein
MTRPLSTQRTQIHRWELRHTPVTGERYMAEVPCTNEYVPVADAARLHDALATFAVHDEACSAERTEMYDTDVCEVCRLLEGFEWTRL